MRAALDKFLAERGTSAPGYDAAKPPIAVLPWSDALVSGDPAELVFLRLTTRVDFKFDDAWWEIIPVVQGTSARASGLQSLHLVVGLGVAVPARLSPLPQDDHGQLSRALPRGPRRECRQYLMRLWVGWKEGDAVDYARQNLSEEKSRPAGVGAHLRGGRRQVSAARAPRPASDSGDARPRAEAPGPSAWMYGS